MSKFFDERLNNLSTYTPGEQPRDISSFIKLNTNESPFPPSQQAQKLIKDEIEKLNLYPDPEAKVLVKAVANYYGKNPENICVFNGSDEVLSFCFQIFCQNGATFADITYGFYPVYAQVFKVKTDIIPVREDFTIEVDDYKGKAGTVFIANPNATTGLALPLCKIEELLCQDKSRLVVVDEAYVDFGADSAVSLIEKYDNLLVVQTMSKSRSYAGARLGLAIANKELINDLNRIRYCFNPYNINRLSMVGAVGAFCDKEYFESCRQEIIKNREYLKAELKKLGFYVSDSMSNFILAGSDKISGEELYLRLKENKVLVRHFSSDRVKDYVRITIGTKMQLDVLLEKIREIIL